MSEGSQWWQSCCGVVEREGGGAGDDAEEIHRGGRGSTRNTNSGDEATSTESSKGEESHPAGYVRRRRAGVSSEAVTKERLAQWKKPFYPKSDNEKEKLQEVIDTKLRVLFGHLSSEAKEAVIDAMLARDVPKDTVLIRQGDEGDNFYVVDSGKFDIFVSRDPKDSPGPLVCSAPSGAAFGELALMYNAPRAATCIAAEDSRVWALDRNSFQMMLVTSENTKKKEYEAFLENIDICQSLTRLERGKLSDILTAQSYPDGSRIITQGERGDRFYIIQDGEAVASICEDGKQLDVKTYGPGGYFGEIALLADVPRKASVTARGDVTVLWIDKETFDRVLGPIKDALEKEVEKYPKYADFLASEGTYERI